VTAQPVGVGATAESECSGGWNHGSLGRWAQGLERLLRIEAACCPRQCSGDFQIAIRVRSLAGGSAPRAAVMLREGVGTGDRFAAVQIAANGALSVVSRAKAGAAATVTTVTGPLVFPNAWLLVERRADKVSLAVSADDVTYRKVGSVTLPGLPQLVQVGAFLGSGTGTLPATAVLGELMS